MAQLRRPEVVAEAKRLARAHDVQLADRVDPVNGEIVYGLRSLHRMYRRGEFETPWLPAKARAEYHTLVRRARSNWLRLVVNVIAQRMLVDGFRTGSSQDDDDAAWARWQANGLDATQGRVHRGMLVFAEAYTTTWPNEGGVPKIVGDSPLMMYGEPDTADVARLGLALKRWATRDGQVGALYDDAQAWMLRRDRHEGWVIVGDPKPHGLGQVPVVRFANEMDLDGESCSEIEPLVPIQLRINETLLDRLMAQKFSSFRQRWATGMVIPEDDDGNPVEPFETAVDRLWMDENPDTRFGEFGQTDLKPFIEAVSDDVRQMSAISQVPPHYLLGNIENIAADGLVAAESGMGFKVDDKKAGAGESWELTMRLAALADGDTTGALDEASEVVWRDTEARSQGALMDGLSKMSGIGVPLAFLLEELGLTPQTIARVMEMKAAEDKAKATTTATSFGMAVPSPDPSGGGADVKAMADALGVLIRAGVDPVDAAHRVGLDGIDFTGAVPVSLRVPSADAAKLEG